MLLFSLIFFTLHAQESSPLVCEVNDYRYSGRIYSDKYKMPAIQGEEACDERAKDKGELLAHFKKTNQQLEAQIKVLKSNTECSDTWPILKKYEEDVEKLKKKFQENQKKRIAYFDDKKKEIDIQREYAYFAAYSSTCKGQDYQRSAFLDLDLINAIPKESPAKTITKNGEHSENCSNVEALGNNNLDSFSVSLKNALGKTFSFFHDVFALPDQVKLLTSAGRELYDSGCVDQDEEKEIKIDLSTLPPDKKIFVKIVGDCEAEQEGKTKYNSNWYIKVTCEMDESKGKCAQPKNLLVELLKQQIESKKKYISAHVTERQCYVHFDQNILNRLLRDGLIQQGSNPISNIPLDQKKRSDKSPGQYVIPAVTAPLPDKPPKESEGYDWSGFDQTLCPVPNPEESLFEKVSRTYCSKAIPALEIL
jgi:hypothetical protein